MDNYLMLDGKKYELSPELANALLSCVEPEPEKVSPFERVKSGETYFAINALGIVNSALEDVSGTDYMLWKAANYCTDKALMEQRAMHETLNRLLWRYSETHGGDAWDRGIGGFCIRRWTDDGFKAFFCGDGKMNGAVFFADRATAEAAIEEVVKPFMETHPDFVW